MGVRRRLDGALEGYFGRGFKLFLALFVAEIVIMGIVLAVPFFDAEQATYTTAAQHTAQAITPEPFVQYWQIFSNNAAITIEEIIPAFGALLYGVVSYNTARTLEVLAIQQSVSAPYLYVFILSLPHSFIELSAYALAAMEGIYLAGAAWKLAAGRAQKGEIGKELEFVGITAVFSLAILAIAAAFEVSEGVLGQYAALDYIPYILLLMWFARFMKRRLPASEAR